MGILHRNPTGISLPSAFAPPGGGAGRKRASPRKTWHGGCQNRLPLRRVKNLCAAARELFTRGSILCIITCNLRIAAKYMVGGIAGMENNVIISIKGLQSFVGMEADAVELVTEGRLEQDGAECFILSYQESELTGLEGTLTTFQIEPERITLLRVGEFNSQMVFQAGRQHLSLYDTPYGALSVGVRTKRLHSRLDPSGGNIEIGYAIEIDHTAAGENHFRIQVKQKPPLLHA